MDDFHSKKEKKKSDKAALFYEEYSLLLMGFSKLSTKSGLPVKCTNPCKMRE